MQARFVAGLQAWFRDENDPRIENAAEGARKFLEAVTDKIGQPNILTGGTTVNPDDIIVLAWRTDGLKTLQIAFKGNDTCTLSWNDSNISSRSTEMTVNDLVLVDVLYIFANLRRRLT